jgi:hypothetical protein
MVKLNYDQTRARLANKSRLCLRQRGFGRDLPDKTLSDDELDMSPHVGRRRKAPEPKLQARESAIGSRPSALAQE